ncbi:MAG: regulatory protein RecX [Ignavibacteriaceae bacterium]
MNIVKVEKKNDNTIIVYLDNNEKLFLSYEVFLKNGLKKNDEISESRFSLLIRENQKYFIKQRAYNFLSRRSHSEFELLTKLRQKGYDADLISPIIEELKENKYVDDLEFSREFTGENIRRKRWGKNKVKSALIRRHVDRDIISNVLAENFNAENEAENALALGAKKLKLLAVKPLPKEKLEQKLYSYLSTKGFDFEVIQKVIDSLLDQ